MDEAFGIIPISRGKTLLVKHQKGHWSFPKGHANAGETPQETAIRELKEETGLTIVHFLGREFQEHYSFDGTDKTVTYFLAEVAGEIALQADEIADSRWLTFEEAAALATFEECRKLVGEVQAHTHLE